MKIQPVASPHAVAPVQTNAQAQNEARARAIAKVQGQTPQAPEPSVPTPNPIPVDANNISAEEISAVSAQNTTIEATEPTDTQQAPPPKETEDPLSKQYAQLARREKALRIQKQQQDQALRQREEALKAKEAELAAKDREYQEGYIPKSRLKQNTLDVLAENELTYDEITRQQMEAQEVNPHVRAHIQRLEAKLQKLEANSEALRKAAESQQADSYQAAVKQIRSDVNHLVKQGDEYEAIRATNSQKDVVSLVESVFREGLLKDNALHDQDWEYEPGTVLSAEDAAQIVENHLIEEIDRLNKIQKVQKRLKLNSTANSTTSEQTKTPTTTGQRQTQTKTLTNDMGSTRKLTSRERAIMAAEGRLKS